LSCVWLYFAYIIWWDHLLRHCS